MTLNNNVFGVKNQRQSVIHSLWYLSNKFCQNLVPLPENSWEFGTGSGEFPGIFHFLSGSGIDAGKMVPEKRTGTGKNSGYHLVRFSDPHYVVTFKSVGESD